MSTLSNAGLNSFEVKLILGKKIPTTDRTYLQTLKQSAFEKYQKAYAFHLSVCGGFVNGKQKADRLAEVVRELFLVAKDQGLLRMLPKDRIKELESP